MKLTKTLTRFRIIKEIQSHIQNNNTTTALQVAPTLYNSNPYNSKPP